MTVNTPSPFSEREQSVPFVIAAISLLIGVKKTKAMPFSGCKSPKRFRKAGTTRRDARRGRDLQGCRIAPGPKA